MELQEDCYRLQQVLKNVEPRQIIRFLRTEVPLEDTEIRCQLALQHFLKIQDEVAKNQENYEAELKADYLCIKHLVNVVPDEEIQELLRTLGPIRDRKYVAVKLLLQRLQTTRKKRKNGSKHINCYEASRKLVKKDEFDEEAINGHKSLDLSKGATEQRESLILTFKNIKDKNGNDKFMVAPLNKTSSENGAPKNCETKTQETVSTTTEDVEISNQENNDLSIIEITAKDFEISNEENINSTIIEVMDTDRHEPAVPAIKLTQSVAPFQIKAEHSQNQVIPSQNEAGPSRPITAESFSENIARLYHQHKPKPPQNEAEHHQRVEAGPSQINPGPPQGKPGPSQSIPGPSQSIPGPPQSIPGPSRSISGPLQSIPGPSQSILGQSRIIAKPLQIQGTVVQSVVYPVNQMEIIQILNEEDQPRETITPPYNIRLVDEAGDLSVPSNLPYKLNPTFDAPKENTDNGVDLSKKTRVIDEKLVYKIIEMFPEACPDYVRDICEGKTWSEQNFDDIVSVMCDSDGYPRRPERQPSPVKAVDPEEQLNTLKEVFLDADPSWLQEKLDQFGGDQEALTRFMEETLESHNYPTMKDYLRKQQLSAQQRQYTTEFNVERFVELFPDPKPVFEDPERISPILDPTDKCYVKWCMRNQFRELYAKDIHNIVEKEGMKNIASIVHALNERKKESCIKKSRGITTSRPDIQNIPLLQELAYFEHKDQITRHVESKKKQAELARQNAKELGLLQTCSCCFDEEVMPNDILTCAGGCRFCRDCIKRGTEVAFSEGKVEFRCLANCDAEFSLQVLQNVLPPKLFSKLAQKKAIAEVKAAGVEDLETCPFCDFATIPAPEDRLFRCLNPDCMKESCRLCKEPSHVPLRCEEVEKDEAVKARTYIEDKMTEALIRQCWKCNAKFIKEEGCNKMTCQCGALMCYVCRKPVKDYRHFNGQGGDRHDLCPLYTDNFSVNENNVLKAAEQAKREINPAQLINDPTADLHKHFGQKIKAAKQRKQHHPARINLHGLPAERIRQIQGINREHRNQMLQREMLQAYYRVHAQRQNPGMPAPPQAGGHVHIPEPAVQEFHYGDV